MPDTWDDRIDAVWNDDTLSDAERIERIDALAAERGEDDPVALFERAGARDSAGLEAEAEELYVRALAGGLDDVRRQRAVIQLASTIRNLGRVDESLAMLREEYDRARAIAHAGCRRRLLCARAGVRADSRSPRHPSPSRRWRRTFRGTPARSPATPRSCSPAATDGPFDRSRARARHGSMPTANTAGRRDPRR